MEKYHVLVVEDDNEIANAIKIYLQNQKNYMRITGITVQWSRECWRSIKRYIPIFLIILLCIL